MLGAFRFPRQHALRSNRGNQCSRSHWTFDGQTGSYLTVRTDVLTSHPNEPHLDRMDRELKVEQLKWPLYVLDDVIVAPCARSSQFIRASGLSAEGQR